MPLPRGITKTPTGFRAFVRVHAGKGGLKSKRFPATATVTDLKHWREDTRVKHRATPAGPLTRGTLAADIQRYLQLVATMPSIADRTRDLQAWSAVLGMRRRADLTRDDYRLVLNEWRLTPLAASTVNHRRTAMMHLYTILDGKGAPNPLREIPPFEPPPAEPRDLTIATVKRILKQLPRSKTRARLKVLAWTGIRGNSELKRMKPEHVDLKRQRCWVPTGKGGRPRILPLNAAGVAAWREFIRLQAWGPYSKDSLRRSFNRACTKLGLEGKRPYDLRHTIAAALRRAGADLADIQQHLGHTSPRMTQRYAPYQSEKLRKALGRLR